MKCSRTGEDISCSTVDKAQRPAVSVTGLKCPQVASKEISKSKNKRSDGRANGNVGIANGNVVKKTVRLNLKKTFSSPEDAKSRQPISSALLTTILSMLEESISPFTASENNAVEGILKKITHSVQQALKKLKVPKVKWTDGKSLQTSQRILSAEKERLEDLECVVSSTLDEEIRKTKLFQTKRDRMKTLPKKKG